MKKVLIITYYWPPSGGSGVQRWLKFVKYFREFGIEPIILTVDPNFATFPFTDKSLIKDIPPGIEIYHTKAQSPFDLYSKIKGKSVPQSGFSDQSKPGIIDRIIRFIRGNFFIPDARIGWNKYAFKKAQEIIEKYNLDTVITTSPPHSTQLIGLKLKQKFKLRWIADLRDPWTEIYYNKKLYRTFFAKKKDYKMEQLCLKNADKIVVVSEDIKRNFGDNRKEIIDKIYVIPNGFDENDFANLEVQSKKKEQSDFKVISYVGNLGELYPTDGFLEAFEALIRKEKDWKLQFVGNCSGDVKRKVDSLKLSQNVEFISYVDHSEAIKYMLNATILLLIIPEVENNKGILTGKLFEYLATGNPILNLGPKDGDAAKILSENAISMTANPNDKQEIINFITNTSKSFNVKEKAKNIFSRRNLTRQVSKLILD
jgi:glycosyltransferase involved in cell wall biosynthesis